MDIKGKNLVLIGFMGSGKSFLGRVLAQRLQRTFVDTDKEIEKLYKLPVAEIFRRFGETTFRSNEHLLVQKLARQSELVIATGGGLLLNRENIALLKSNGIFIRVEAAPHILHERLTRKHVRRPLIKKGLTLEELKQQIAGREKLYTDADIIIDNGNLGRKQAVSRLLELLSS